MIRWGSSTKRLRYLKTPYSYYDTTVRNPAAILHVWDGQICTGMSRVYMAKSCGKSSFNRHPSHQPLTNTAIVIHVLNIRKSSPMSMSCLRLGSYDDTRNLGMTIPAQLTKVASRGIQNVDFAESGSMAMMSSTSTAENSMSGAISAIGGIMAVNSSISSTTTH